MNERNRDFDRLDQRDREALIASLRFPRFELSPSPVKERAIRKTLEKVAERTEKQTRQLPRNTKVTVTCPRREGGIDIDLVLQVTEYLRGAGFTVVPHLAARSVLDEEHLREIMERLKDLDVKEIFVPGGDRDDPLGKFSSSFELLREIAELGYRFEEVGITAYPQGHPNESVGPTLLQSLQDKQPFATYMITQLGFKANLITDWIADMRDLGIELPVYIGIAGSVSKIRLAAISKTIGVSGSKSFAKTHPDFIREIFLTPGLDYKPDKLLARIAPYLSDERYNIRGFHIYTFNQADNTEKWRCKLLASLASSPPG